MSAIVGYAFDGCESLTSMTIPDSVTKIGEGAFMCCTNLTSVNVDEKNCAFRIIDGVLFNKEKTILICYPIGKADKVYTIPDGVTEIGSAFGGCISLTSITIPESVTEIGEWAFYYCTGLTSITIPESVTKIGREAFRGCKSLTSITIPESVTEIGKEAFYGCDSLTSVTIPDSATEIGILAFSDCTSLTIHAPAGSYAEQYAKENDIKFEVIK